MPRLPAHSPPAAFETWLHALEERHLSNLRFQEVTRALRALSSVYVERRREAWVSRAALDSSGKRAAFALFYAPLHFLTTYSVIRSLAEPGHTRNILDLGCGSGAAGAAWALVADAFVTGVDRHPWAVTESRWTYQQLGVRGSARQADIVRTLPKEPAGGGIIAAYLLNELTDTARQALLDALMRRVSRGSHLLIVEPIALRVSPWWSAASRAVENAGGRADEWRFDVDLPPLLRLLDKAAGLNHAELTSRTLYCPGGNG
jgi:SAM-dependent methyltransferase